MPVRRGHVAPQNTYLDTIIRKFEGQSEYRTPGPAPTPPSPNSPPPPTAAAGGPPTSGHSGEQSFFWGGGNTDKGEGRVGPPTGCPRGNEGPPCDLPGGEAGGGGGGRGVGDSQAVSPRVFIDRVTQGGRAVPGRWSPGGWRHRSRPPPPPPAVPGLGGGSPG